MGGGASVPAPGTTLSDAGKAALLTHLQGEYEAHEAMAASDEKSLLNALKQSYDVKAKELGEAEDEHSGSKEDLKTTTETAAAAAAFADKLGKGVDPLANTSKTSQFRKRRLSVTTVKAARKATEPNVGGKPSVLVMYRSEEIGAAPDAVPLPFPEAKQPRSTRNVVGTYSCHGVEPSFDDDEEGAVMAKINQDRGCVVYPFNEDNQQALFCVFDGHGEHGDVVSDFVMHELRSRLVAHPSLLDDPSKALKESFVQIDESLRSSKPIEATFSGTTAVCVLVREGRLWVANAGDSRAVLATKKGAALKAVDLSIDQNPHSPGEKARIEAAGGFVSLPPEPGLSSRVWLDKTMTQIGLAMARSIGDHAVKSIGVIAKPEVNTHKIEPVDKFVVLASDGVWEFISSQEAVDIVNASLGEGTMKATQSLIEVAAKKWQEVEGDYRDDITAVVVRLPCFPQ
ncbi:unnamed protein product [Ascophyllum nodosum]